MRELSCIVLKPILPEPFLFSTLGSGVHPSLLQLKVGWFIMSPQGPTGGPR
jgi:hypothetical protein